MSVTGQSGAAGATPAPATGEMPASTDQANLSLARAAQPYPPSWIDRLTAWVERLPGPAWLYYLGAGVVFTLIRTVIGWSDGGYPVGTFFPAHILDGFSAAYLLFVLHYLDTRADAALTAFRPVLAVDDAGYELLRYQLTTMPARPALAWSLVGMVFGAVDLPFLLPETQLQSLRYFTSPAATVVDIGLAALGWMFNGAFLYHTVHQLRLVSRIYTHHTNVNVFETGPLYALSRVSAMTAVALFFITYLYLALWSNWQFGSLADASVGVAFILVALGTFVWPLLGAHNLLQQERAHRKSEVGRRLEAVTNELHRRTDAGDYSDMANMDHAIDGLIKERGVLDKVSTWPWEPETVRVVVTALLLPAVLWTITRVLERLGL